MGSNEKREYQLVLPGCNYLEEILKQGEEEAETLCFLQGTSTYDSENTPKRRLSAYSGGSNGN